MRSAKKNLFLGLKWAFLIIILAFIYIPIFLIIIYSISGEPNIGGVNGFGQFTFALYQKLFTGGSPRLIEATKNTLIIGVSSALIATFIGTLTSVGLYYLRKGKKAVNFVSQITVINADIVTAVGFFLLSIFLSRIGLPIEKGMGWLIIAHAVITTPYVILTVSPRLHQLNPNLYEAGLDLGAGPMRSLFTVIIPQLIGGMISGFALAFTLSLDDFVVTNLNKGTNGVETITTFVYASLRRSLDPAIRALSTIIFVVVLVALIIFNIVKNKKIVDQQKNIK